MIREAEVFVRADEAVAGVFAQVRADQWLLVLPPVFDMPGADKPVTLREAVTHLARDDAWVPDMLAGRTMDEAGRCRFDGDLLGEDPGQGYARIARAATAAARQVTDPDAPVHCSYGDAPMDNYFWQLNIARCLTAHDVAGVIGVPSPLTEELSRAMYEGTEPEADTWRQYGIYREKVRVPASASWRDRFLALTGRTP
jgi:hypothetical protein